MWAWMYWGGIGVVRVIRVIRFIKAIRIIRCHGIIRYVGVSRFSRVVAPGIYAYKPRIYAYVHVGVAGRYNNNPNNPSDPSNPDNFMRILGTHNRVGDGRKRRIRIYYGRTGFAFVCELKRACFYLSV